MRENLEYIRPKTVAEATQALAEAKGRSAIINGGTDMMIDLRSGKFKGDRLVDISGLADLKVLKEEGGQVIVGAGVTIEELRQSDLIKTKLPALALCAEKFAGQQVRNQGTIGGNVAHASPSGDTQPPLVIYEAVAVVAGPAGEKEVPVTGLFKAANVSTLADDEIIVRFVMKPQAARLNTFQKIGRRNDLAISRASLAVLADVDGAGAFNLIRISLGACKPTAGRMPKTEAFLLGKKPSLALIKEAAKVMSAEMIEVTGRRASVVYKEPAIEGLLVRILIPCLKMV